MDPDLRRTSFCITPLFNLDICRTPPIVRSGWRFNIRHLINTSCNSSITLDWARPIITDLKFKLFIDCCCYHTLTAARFQSTNPSWKSSIWYLGEQPSWVCLNFYLLDKFVRSCVWVSINDLCAFCIRKNQVWINKNFLAMNFHLYKSNVVHL